MNTSIAPRKTKGFTSVYGTFFKDVREISYDDRSNLLNIGKLVAQTSRENINYTSDIERGVYIFQCPENPETAYRIYNEYADYDFNGYMDEELIQYLAERQSNIKLSKFPTGVVTCEGRVIGQEIPYFPNSLTLLEYSKIVSSASDMVEIYLHVLTIIEELYINGIIYIDCNPNNFLIHLKDGKHQVEIIDFDPMYIKYKDYNNVHLKQMLYNYKTMIEKINKNFEINTDYIEKPENFDSAICELDKISKKLCLR